MEGVLGEGIAKLKLGGGGVVEEILKEKYKQFISTCLALTASWFSEVKMMCVSESVWALEFCEPWASLELVWQDANEWVTFGEKFTCSSREKRWELISRVRGGGCFCYIWGKWGS